jgi:hypothetical protein
MKLSGIQRITQINSEVKTTKIQRDLVRMNSTDQSPQLLSKFIIVAFALKNYLAFLVSYPKKISL